MLEKRTPIFEALVHFVLMSCGEVVDSLPNVSISNDVTDRLPLIRIKVSTNSQWKRYMLTCELRDSDISAVTTLGYVLPSPLDD